MPVTELRLRTTEEDLEDATGDIETVLDLDGTVLDLSPGFRRLLLELEDAFLERLT
jgi:hypothetical protein